jgi:hypothetical protein
MFLGGTPAFSRDPRRTPLDKADLADLVYISLGRGLWLGVLC